MGDYTLIGETIMVLKRRPRTKEGGRGGVQDHEGRPEGRAIAGLKAAFMVMNPAKAPFLFRQERI